MTGTSPSRNNEGEVMKRLKLQRETIAILSGADLENVYGGAQISIIRQTTACPVQTNGCTGGPCIVTIGTSGTSVINPSGG
jgi:hypothetical protein